MGVPKFFRYISERYPCLSELVREYQIPEFDNLYLDMNGIIHMCSHPDDENVHFRISEEQIFKDIFHYIEVLFRMIRPQKLFFMAVDGVAPRAKMNQQRGRRFRSAKEAEKREKDAEKKGEVLPEVARFDSNCITPGTVFMARLHEQLKYFVVDKISNDSLWQNCKVILSGHETPGEGEHKIMDYIRYMRAQSGYDPNTRHCLYGLDADLIMLGLCTHEPHFSLLREEVKFGRKSTKRISVPEEITFYLLHLSLMREYLELEFASLKESLTSFEFDIDKIIDDWVLMGFLVGNDFIPHLPNLHITNGALPFLYKAYMEVLPTLHGYINENGELNLLRFEKFMEKLSGFDVANFEEIRDDLLYMEAKTGRKQSAHTKVTCNPSIEDAVEISGGAESISETPRDAGLAALIQEADDFAQLSLEEEEELENDTDGSEDEAFTNYKREYYQNKLEFVKVTAEVMRNQAEGYVRAIQWNLNYYYKGCSSWSWYYPHHYAPYISDIKGFSNLNLKFDIGKPFLPFEQLLAVLPPASKDLLPHCYHDLMTKENSLIKKYYPENFQTDLNGKKQEWEAVVLVPFIDENLLLEAMSYCNHHLTEEEAARNKHGPMLIYTYTDKDKGPYHAPEFFPPIASNHAEIKTLMYDDVMIPKEKLIPGVHPDAQMSVYYPGFPTLKHLKYKAELKIAKIKVFDYASRGENMVITVIPNDKISSGEMIPVDLLGNTVFVKWPHLTEAKVVAISNSKRKYVNMGQGQYNAIDQTHSAFKNEIEGISDFYEKRMGILVGETKVLVYVQTLMGKKFLINAEGQLLLEKQFTPNISCYPLQVIVYNIKAFDGHQTAGKEIEHIFPKNSICFTVTNPYYGSKGVVQENLLKKNGRLKITVTVQEEPDFKSVEECRCKLGRSYKTLHSAASQLTVSNNMFSRITGSLFVKVPGNEGTLKNFNIGLDLKMNKKNLEIPGYTKKFGTTWHYSDKATELVRNYCERFPEVFDYLASDSNFDAINPEDIFGEDWEDRLTELKEWLRSLPSYGLDRQICGSIILEPEVIGEIEKVVDNFRSSKIKNVTMQIKPMFLYRPEIQSGTIIPDPKMDVRILDRIVNVRCGFSVPFGHKGTVTAIQEPLTGCDRDTMYDVVFDSPFKDGMKLNCSERRGYRLPKYSFINISYGKRLLEQKIGKTEDVIAASLMSIPNNPFSNTFNQYHAYQPYHKNSTQQFGQQNSAFAQVSSFSHLRQNYEQRESTVKQQNRLPHTSQNQYEKLYEPPGVFNPYNRQNFNYFQNQSNDFSSIRNQTTVDNSSIKYNKLESSVATDYGKGGLLNERSNLQYTNGKFNRPERLRNEAEITEDSRGTGNAKKDSSKKQLVNVDFLKNLLKASGIANQQTSNPAPLSSQSTSDKPKEFNLQKEVSANHTSNKQNSKYETIVSFDQLTQVANAPASIRLLTYYQSNGLGLPIYQYLNGTEGLQAQITLSDGRLIVGKPAQSREEASENVAANVLELFIKNKAKTDTSFKEEFPTPPETWVQSEKNSNGIGSSHSCNQSTHKTKTETSALLNNSFVPLQAVKNHINKTTKQTSKSIKENIQHAEKITDKSGDKGANTTNVPQKGRKERKTRIAANFDKK